MKISEENGLRYHKKGGIVKPIPFGSWVQDRVTGFEGYVTYRLEHLNGCIRYAVQPKVDESGKLPKDKILDGPNLDVVRPPDGNLPPAVETPNEFKLGVKVRDRLTGFTGIVVSRIKIMYAGDRYGIQAPVDDKGEIPEIMSFDEGDLEQIDPSPSRRKEDGKEKPPAGPHDPDKAMSR